MCEQTPIFLVTRYGEQFTFKCPACGRRHYHGAGEGHVLSHCRTGAFPDGYILKLADTAGAIEGGRA